MRRIWARPRDLRAGLRIDRAVALVWQAAPGWTALNLGLVVVQGILPLAGLYLLKRIVDAVQFGITASNKTAAFQNVLFWILLAAATALLIAIARSISELSNQTQSMIVTDKVADIIHAQSIAVDLSFYEDPRYYDTLQRAQAEAPYRPTTIIGRIMQIGQSLISVLGILGLLLSFNPLIGAIIVLVAFPGALVRLVFSRRLYRFEQEQAKSERRAWYYHWILTDSRHAKEVRLFNLGDLFRRRFREQRKELRGGRLGIARRRTFSDFLAQTITTLAIFSTLAFIAHRAVQGHITIGDLVMYYSSFQIGISSLQSILQGLAGLYEDNLFLANFYQFLELQPKIRAPDTPRALPTPMRKGITFEQVGFVYPGSGQRVLENVNFELSPGQVVALVGENGSGKTTLIKLLCRLYDP
ncbi:MAG: ABC transporter ATP-binding protein, partial [candidate division WOR-3 bacterium]